MLDDRTRMVGTCLLTCCCCIRCCPVVGVGDFARRQFGPTGTVLPVEGEAFSARLVSVDGAGRVVFQPDVEGGASAAEAVGAIAD